MTATTAASTWHGFEPADFDVFSIEGLEPRMEQLIGQVRPKLHVLGDLLSPYLAELCGETFFPHVAKHARRTVNPPHDTWVAFAPSKRGYKAFPHFQIGLWGSHVFVQFAIIYESTSKGAFAERALAELASVRQSIPADFVWSKDHMVPEGLKHSDLTDDELAGLFERLRDVKAAELTCGIHMAKDDPRLKDPGKFVEIVKSVFATLLPLYRMA